MKTDPKRSDLWLVLYDAISKADPGLGKARRRRLADAAETALLGTHVGHPARAEIERGAL